MQGDTYFIDNNGNKKCVLVCGTKYEVDDTLAIYLELAGTGETYTILTVNLEDSLLMSHMFSSPVYHTYVAYVDTNNCPWAEKFIADNELGKPVRSITARSGYCEYPLYEFYLYKFSFLDETWTVDDWKE